MSTRAFTVEMGRSGDFPLDMLRYDCCWPDSTEDAEWIRRLQLSADERGDMPSRIKIRLRADVSAGSPTPQRWASYGVTVLEGRIG